ncbi:MAG: universal stress protein [bacterium]|nr:universal stress protein [bacterium]
MFKKILYPTDFSDVSKNALAYIKQLQEAGTKEVIVLHVIDERGLEVITQYAPELEEKLAEKPTEELNAIEAELKECGFDVTVRLKSGIPTREILKAERDESISAIVLGSHGKSNLKEIFIGSVSEQVIRKSTKPVLVIKR